MNLFFSSEIQDGTGFLNLEESHHCTHVLRKTSGDHINVTDGKGNFYDAKLTGVNNQKCHFEVLSMTRDSKTSHSIHIAIAPTKNADRIEWFVEKAVEIGVNKITFLQSEYSERRSVNLKRIRKKVISAMKQSFRSHLPDLVGVVKLSYILENEGDQKFIAHLDDKSNSSLRNLAKPGKEYMILIGPEGGFTDLEVSEAEKKGFEKVKISDNRLRTETAGIVACALLNDINL